MGSKSTAVLIAEAIVVWMEAYTTPKTQNGYYFQIPSPINMQTESKPAQKYNTELPNQIFNV